MCFGGSPPPPPPPPPADEPAPPEYMITKKQATDEKLFTPNPDIGLRELQIDRTPNELKKGSGMVTTK